MEQRSRPNKMQQIQWLEIPNDFRRTIRLHHLLLFHKRLTNSWPNEWPVVESRYAYTLYRTRHQSTILKRETCWIIHAFVIFINTGDTEIGICKSNFFHLLNTHKHHIIWIDGELLQQHFAQRLWFIVHQRRLWSTI